MTETVSNKQLKPKVTLQSEFQELTAAESYMLLNPTWSKREEIFRFTVIDLVLKKILKIEWLSKTIRGRVRRNLYLSSAENFDSHQPLQSEKQILKFYRSNNCSNVLRAVAKQVYKESDKFERLKKKDTFISLVKKGMLVNIPILANQNLYILTNKGKSLRAKLKSKLKEIEALTKKESDLAKNEECLQHLNELGTNFIIIENFDFESLKSLKNADGINSRAMTSFGTYYLFFEYALEYNDTFLSLGDFASGSSFDFSSFGDFDTGGFDF